MNHKECVERLAEIMQGKTSVPPRVSKVFINMAKAVINAGYIHKSQAIEYVEFCRNCTGNGIGNHSTYIKCPTCSCSRIVLRKD